MRKFIKIHNHTIDLNSIEAVGCLISGSDFTAGYKSFTVYTSNHEIGISGKSMVIETEYKKLIGQLPK